ncbi:DUF1684 domain-containing protein [uncultured Amnibacterium sp.]|uniref:DUF1684 domain-containing protein n=1 Tax=uncultured Amnibacterium sp. TaxID=1631851 RepID=UPI0035C9EEB4
MSLTSADPIHQRTVELAREQRLVEATGPRGAASFVWGDFVTAPGTTVAGAAGRWSPPADGRAGLVVEATAGEGVRIGGQLVDGTAVLFLHPEDGETAAQFADGAEGVLFSYDQASFALQVWNPAIAADRGFAGIAAYPVDPSWVAPAAIAPVAPGRTVVIAHHRDPRPVEVPVVAEARFHRDGAPHRLVASAGLEPGELLLHFTDATTGGETSGSGRVLRIAEDATVLDFNLAGLLPCSFSPAWNCPLPPAENRLPVPVRAGERTVVDANGETIE